MSNERENNTINWYAIHTKPKQEWRAGLNLWAWNIENFIPKVKGRQRCHSANSVSYVAKPLFPRYIFARFNPDMMLHKIIFTRGVHSVVRFGGVPAPVDDCIINLLRLRVGKDEFIKFTEEFKSGDKVIIQEGPLKNFVGVLDKDVKEDERVRILLTTVSYQSHVTIEREWIKKLTPPVTPAIRPSHHEHRY